MIKLKIGKKSRPRHFDCFLVMAQGYWGDMDETLNFEEEFSNSPIGAQYAADTVFMLKECENCKYETRSAMEEYLKECGIDVDRIYIPVDCHSYEMVPSTIEGIQIYWFDEDGVSHDVSIVKEESNG